MVSEYTRPAVHANAVDTTLGMIACQDLLYWNKATPHMWIEDTSGS